nr:NAD(P)H-hydrate dehydratase [uncultured Agathobaculum sp.]
MAEAFIEINQAYVDGILPCRQPDADKNAFGRVLCVCGSAGYTGAAYFAAQGAVRMGSGVVTLATPEKAWPVLAVKLNEPVVRPMPCGADGMLSREALPVLTALTARADAVLIGCGLGRSDAVAEIVCGLLQSANCPVVLDADGINALSAHKDVLRQTAQPVVLTPHAAEFARLSGIQQPENEELSAFAQENHCILLYKGHRTRIFAPDGTVYRNHSGNPGMAKGGSGDVLAGMLVSLCGQGIAPVQAACAAAWLHGRAGDAAANRLSEYGMTPGDMLHELPGLLKRYNTREW